MRDWNQFKTPAQSEALINELKGNLFEFLVALEMATQAKCHSRFMREFGGSYKEQLNRYETWLRNHRPNLRRQLPFLAKACAQKLRQTLGEKESNKIDRVMLLGKLAGASHHFAFKEADVVLASGDKLFPISLKFCKAGAFVNTKSAGIFSFLNGYFAQFYGNKGEDWQRELNQRVYTSFYQMGRELYAKAELEFTGRFDSHWKQAGYSDLPGQLPSAFQEIVLLHYQRVREKIYEAFCDFSQQRENFVKALNPIVGFGKSNLIQLTCYHCGTEDYSLDDIEIFEGKNLDFLYETLELKKKLGQKASFEIQLKNRLLQIRVKPMNKFTVEGLKVNCSVKRI